MATLPPAATAALVGSRVLSPPLRYHATQGEVSAWFTSAGNAPDLVTSTGTAVRYLATSESSGGDFGLFRWDMGCDPSMLILFAPGAPREDYFEGLEQLGQRATPPTDLEREAFLRSHDQFTA